MRRNLHLGIGFLAATSGDERPGPPSPSTPTARPSTAGSRRMEAGAGEPCSAFRGLGGTKASFLTTVAALAGTRRVIAIDLPGFGDSDKPLNGRYDAPWFAEAVLDLLDALGLARADLIGNSMGGRVAIEVGLCGPDRVGRLVLLSPSMAWLRQDRALNWLLAAPAPAPRDGPAHPAGHRRAGRPPARARGDRVGSAAGVDEFLRALLHRRRALCLLSVRTQHRSRRAARRDRVLAPARGAVAAERCSSGAGRHAGPDRLHEARRGALPAAAHVELDCGHVPQVEAPGPTHAAIARFLGP